MDIVPFITNLLDEIYIFVLFTRGKSFGCIWSLGTMLWGYIIWVAGRFLNRHKRCIREEDNKLNKQVIAKLLIQMSLLVLYWLMR
jgi:hypothetical protein